MVLFQYFIIKTFSGQENLHYPKFNEEEEYFRGFVQLGLRTTAGTELWGGRGNTVGGGCGVCLTGRGVTKGSPELAR